MLDGFAALTEGTVSVVLRGAGGGETVFSIDNMTRPGIFSVPVVPDTAGEYGLAFRVETATQTEEIAAGRVRVGEAGDPGGLIEAAPVSAAAEAAATSGAGADRCERGCVTLLVAPADDKSRAFEIQVSRRGAVFDTRYDAWALAFGPPEAPLVCSTPSFARAPLQTEGYRIDRAHGNRPPRPVTRRHCFDCLDHGQAHPH